MSDSFDTWDGPRSVPPTGRDTHRDLHGACDRRIEKLEGERDDMATVAEYWDGEAGRLSEERDRLLNDVSRLTAERDRLRSELAACRREIERLRERCRELDDHLAGVGAVTSVRSSSAATVDGVDRLRSELAEARDALLRRDEPCCDDRRIYDGGAYFKPYCVNCGRPA